MRRSTFWLVNFVPIFMPALSPSMETGVIVEWKKKVGDYVKENDVFCTVQTDKAVVDYTNTFDPGYLAKIYLENGQEAPVAKTIAVMVDEEADVAKANEYVPDDAVEGSPAAETQAESPTPTATPTPPSTSSASGNVTSEPPDAEFSPIFMPALSPSMETGVIVEWKKKVGDYVKENDVFCTVQTDKAVVDYTNTFDPGYLAKIYLENGQEAPVAKTIALLVTEESDIPKFENYYPEDAAGAAPAAPAPTTTSPTPTTPSPSKSTTAARRYGATLEEAIQASGPSVVRIAAGLTQAELESVTPTGKDGRFLKSDFIGMKGFDYNDDVEIVPSTASPKSDKSTTASPVVSSSSATASNDGDIYSIVIKGSPVKVRVDDTKVLQNLLSTMTMPKKKVLKQKK